MDNSFRDWTQVKLTVALGDLETASAIMSMIDNNLQIEDYSDIDLKSCYGDLIDESILNADKTIASVSVYIPAEKSYAEALSFIREHMKIAGIDGKLSVVGVNEEDWANSWKAFSEAMGNAQKVYADESATQDQVDAAIKQLEEAQQTLVKKADTTELKTVLDQAQGVSGDLYTEASAKKLAEAVDAASKVLNDENATQADADAAVKQLTEAIAGLELKPAPKPDDDKTDPKPSAKPGNKPVSKSEVSAAISSTGSNVIGIAVVGMIVLLTGAAIMLTRRNRD